MMPMKWGVIVPMFFRRAIRRLTIRLTRNARLTLLAMIHTPYLTALENSSEEVTLWAGCWT